MTMPNTADAPPVEWRYFQMTATGPREMTAAQMLAIANDPDNNDGEPLDLADVRWLLLDNEPDARHLIGDYFATCSDRSRATGLEPCEIIRAVHS